MTIERLQNGAIRLSTIHRGYLVSRTYYGYTRQEAQTMFKQFIKEN